MKIMTVTYFYDFARYFLFLEKNIYNTYSEVEFFNVSIYPCAHRYWKKNKYHSVMPAISTNVKGKYSIDNNLDLIDKLISFNNKALNLFGKDEVVTLRKNAVKYLNYFDEKFAKSKFDYVITSGESRLIPAIIIYIAKKYNVRIIYFEQGPFGTTMIDRKGVNANISFEPTFRELKKFEVDKLSEFVRSIGMRREKFWTAEQFSFLDRVYRFMTTILMYPPRILEGLFPKDLSLGPSFSKGYLEPFMKKHLPNKLKLMKNVEVECVNEPYIALYLQVPVDAQLIEHAPHYQCFYQMVKDVIEVIPEGYHLLIREHPQYQGKYDSRIYDLVDQYENVSFQNYIDLKKMIVGSSCSILNNSAVGIESLLLGVNVVCLGEAYYSHRGITYDFHGNFCSLRELIYHACTEKFNTRKVESFLYEFIFDYLQDGHFQDKELVFPSVINEYL
ncbi:hypothetical protein BS333_01280 [Vibrio azureus]|uniref:Capsule polysaccharide biosynthesis protein n=1 Tax=Vibrio azureus NBRC 104587 TaxID=1219077 RepID=U3AN48_9VIBR|nr:hypothetical protein [Vibrio azureus]AUI85124.1 hypothetical protein BS333_01280 [Vibrio azureus]GAD75200.1 hypothetical protein VAZ01S_021_00110 [Vibrio azureus NBRC 104587]